MKKFTKLLLVTAMAVLSAVACFALSACGGEAKIKGIYLSPAVMSYQNMRDPTLMPEIGAQNYYLTTFTQQELTLYEDGKYCLIVSSSTFSAIELNPSTQDYKGNENANSIVRYYGTYTSAVNDLDEDMLDITLAKPTRILAKNDDKIYLDTSNWTDEMGKATRKASGYNPSTGEPIIDEGTPNQTAEGYLGINAFNEVKLQANTKKPAFDYIKLEFPKN